MNSERTNPNEEHSDLVCQRLVTLTSALAETSKMLAGSTRKSKKPTIESFQNSIRYNWRAICCYFITTYNLRINPSELEISPISKPKKPSGRIGHEGKDRKFRYIQTDFEVFDSILYDVQEMLSNSRSTKYYKVTAIKAFNSSFDDWAYLFGLFISDNEMKRVQYHTTCEERLALQKRLSKEIGVKLASDELNLENISIRCRPTTVGGDYHNLVTYEWHDAKCALDDIFGTRVLESEKIHLLRSIFEKAQTVVQDIIQTTPMNLFFDENIKTHGQQFQNQVFDYQRTLVSKAKLEHFIQQVTSSVMRDEYLKHRWKEIKQNPKFEQIETLLKGTVTLVWKMAIQRPPMKFQFNEKLTKDLYEESFNSSDPEKPNHMHIIYPPLFHERKLIVKGKVYRTPVTDDGKVNSVPNMHKSQEHADARVVKSNEDKYSNMIVEDYNEEIDASLEKETAATDIEKNTKSLKNKDKKRKSKKGVSSEENTLTAGTSINTNNQQNSGESRKEIKMKGSNIKLDTVV